MKRNFYSSADFVGMCSKIKMLQGNRGIGLFLCLPESHFFIRIVLPCWRRAFTSYRRSRHLKMIS